LSNEREEQYRALAGRYGVSLGAVEVLAHALQTSGGRQAQFNHPELGGMGQWQPGMIMIGDMFNNGLKARVDALATELSKLITATNSFGSFASMPGFQAAWWPSTYGTPNASGGQNDLSYAYFASRNRLLIKLGGHITTYDTTGEQVTGVSQQQMNSIQIVVFSGPRGITDVRTLPTVL
jgi:hypothetical protein